MICAVGVTTNPFLANRALVKDRTLWACGNDRVLGRDLPPESKAEGPMLIAVAKTAGKVMA